MKLSRTLRLFVAGALIASGFVASGAAHAAPNTPAAIFDVTRFDDPAPSGCSVGDCSLRAAIIAANNAGGGSTINLPAGTYTLTIAGAFEDLSATGDLDIRADISLLGAGEATTIVQGGPGWTDRIFDVVNGAQAQISGVSVRQGSSAPGAGIEVQLGTLVLSNSAVMSNTVTGGGGGLYVATNTGHNGLTLNNVLVAGNTANGFSNGGGVYVAANAALTVTNSAIVSNTATAYGGGLYSAGLATLINTAFYSNTAGFSGGGLFNDTATGVMTLTNGLLVGNQALTGGGGLENYTSATLVMTGGEVLSNTASTGGGLNNFGGTSTLSHVLIDRNSTGHSGAGPSDGGGITNTGPLTITDSTISNNRSTDLNSYGGGLENFNSAVLISNTTVVSNSVNAYGGAIYAWGGHSAVRIVASTLMSNTAGTGGGIYNTNLLTVTNSTLSGNSASGDGGGLYNFYAAVPGPILSLNNATVANNTADRDGNNLGDGGGIVNGSGLAYLQNSLVAGNHDNSPSFQLPDCMGPLISQGYNLLGNSFGCTWAAASGDITNTSALLGPLQDNGGATWTQALLAGSPAVDHGNPLGCRDDTGALLTMDQRGVGRPIGPRCDIGAYEGAVVLFLVDLPVVLR